MSQLDKFEALKALTMEQPKNWDTYYANSMYRAYCKYGTMEGNRKLFSICQDTARRWADKQTMKDK